MWTLILIYCVENQNASRTKWNIHISYLMCACWSSRGVEVEATPDTAAGVGATLDTPAGIRVGTRRLVAFI